MFFQNPNFFILNLLQTVHDMLVLFLEGFDMTAMYLVFFCLFFLIGISELIFHFFLISPVILMKVFDDFLIICGQGIILEQPLFVFLLAFLFFLGVPLHDLFVFFLVLQFNADLLFSQVFGHFLDFKIYVSLQNFESFVFVVAFMAVLFSHPYRNFIIELGKQRLKLKTAQFLAEKQSLPINFDRLVWKSTDEVYYLINLYQMFRRSNLLTTDKYPVFQHTFSSKKHIIFRSYQRDTIQTYLTKRMLVKDDRLLLYYKHHIYFNILPYLRRQNCSKEASILQLHPEHGEVMIKAKYIEEMNEGFGDDSGEQSQDKGKEVDGNALFISKKLVEGMSLRQMILKSDDRIDAQFCHDLVGEMVDFILRNGGVKDLMLTTQNIIFSDSGQFHLNYFSFVGLQFWKLDKYITREQLQQMLPYLVPQFITEEDPNKRKITVQMELKFILLNFFSAFRSKDIIFDSKHINLDVQVKRTDTQLHKLIYKLIDTMLPKLMTNQDKAQIQKFDQKFNVNYLLLLRKVLQEDDHTSQSTKQQTKKYKSYEEEQEIEQKQKLRQQKKKRRVENKHQCCNWEYILANLSKRVRNKNKSVIQDNSLDQFEGYSIQNNQDRFSFNIFQIFDLYINLLDVLSVSSSSQEHKQVFRCLKELKEDRQCLLFRQRYSKSLYIPIMTGMKFSQILEYKNWIHMLNTATQTEYLTLDAVTKLFGIIVDIRQNIESLDPLITDQVIRNAVSQRPDVFNSIHKSFYEYLQNFPNELSEDLDSSIKPQKSLKDEFWRIYFWFLNELLLLLKSFYFRTTQYNITATIKVRRQQFSSIVKNIKPYTPQMSKATDER